MPLSYNSILILPANPPHIATIHRPTMWPVQAKHVTMHWQTITPDLNSSGF